MESHEQAVQNELHFAQVFGSMGRAGSLMTAVHMMLHGFPKETMDHHRRMAMSVVLWKIEGELKASRRMLSKLVDAHVPEQAAPWADDDDADEADDE